MNRTKPYAVSAGMALLIAALIAVDAQADEPCTIERDGDTWTILDVEAGTGVDSQGNPVVLPDEGSTKWDPSECATPTAEPSPTAAPTLTPFDPGSPGGMPSSSPSAQPTKPPETQAPAEHPVTPSNEIPDGDVVTTWTFHETPATIEQTGW